MLVYFFRQVTSLASLLLQQVRDTGKREGGGPEGETNLDGVGWRAALAEAAAGRSVLHPAATEGTAGARSPSGSTRRDIWNKSNTLPEHLCDDAGLV